MGLVITNNVSSLNAQRNINKSQGGLSKSLERLSSGLRINRAGDDAAGLAISEKLRSNVRALSQASRNASDAISLIQTAEGSMNEISSALIRMKELAEQAATGTVGNQERGFLSQEYEALAFEIYRISQNTRFNDTSLLDGSLDTTIQIGVTASETISISVESLHPIALGIGIPWIGDALSAQLALSEITNSIGIVSSRRSELGALQNRFESIVANIENQVENLTGAESRIRDVDIAAETANLTKFSILQQAGVSVLSQANQSPTVALSLLRG